MNNQSDEIIPQFHFRNSINRETLFTATNKNKKCASNQHVNTVKNQPGQDVVLTFSRSSETFQWKKDVSVDTHKKNLKKKQKIQNIQTLVLYQKTQEE
jgi:hypothetical protein